VRRGTRCELITLPHLTVQHGKPRGECAGVGQPRPAFDGHRAAAEVDSLDEGPGARRLTRELDHRRDRGYPAAVQDEEHVVAGRAPLKRYGGEKISALGWLSPPSDRTRPSGRSSALEW